MSSKKNEHNSATKVAAATSRSPIVGLQFYISDTLGWSKIYKRKFKRNLPSVSMEFD